MNWPYFAQVLRANAFHVWLVLHKAHQHLPALTLLAFVLIGLVQTGLAYEAGVLAIKALPLDVADMRSQARYRRFFLSLGVALFILTFIIGLLNDNNQAASDARSLHAEQSLDLLQTRLAEVHQLGAFSQRALIQLRDSLATTKLTPKQERKLQEAERAIRQANDAAAALQRLADNSALSKATAPPAQPIHSLQGVQSGAPSNQAPVRTAPLLPYEVGSQSQALKATQDLLAELRGQEEEVKQSCSRTVSRYRTLYQSDSRTKPSDALPWNIKDDVTKACDVAPKLDPGSVGAVYQALSQSRFQGNVPVLILQGKMYDFLQIAPRFFRVPQTVADLSRVSAQGYLEQEALIGGAQHYLQEEK